MIKYIYYSMIGIVSLVFIGSIYFLYNNFYLTLSGSQEVETLITRVSSVGFDPKKVETVEREIKEKQTLKKSSPLNDPFYHIETSSKK